MVMHRNKFCVSLKYICFNRNLVIVWRNLDIFLQDNVSTTYKKRIREIKSLSQIQIQRTGILYLHAQQKGNTQSYGISTLALGDTTRRLFLKKNLIFVIVFYSAGGRHHYDEDNAVTIYYPEFSLSLSLSSIIRTGHTHARIFTLLFSEFDNRHHRKTFEIGNSAKRGTNATPGNADVCRDSLVFRGVHVWGRGAFIPAYVLVLTVNYFTSTFCCITWATTVYHAIMSRVHISHLRLPLCVQTKVLFSSRLPLCRFVDTTINDGL